MKKRNCRVAHSSQGPITRTCQSECCTIGSTRMRTRKSSSSRCRIRLRNPIFRKIESMLIESWVQAKRTTKISIITWRRTFTNLKLGKIVQLKKLILKRIKQSAHSSPHFTPKRINELLRFEESNQNHRTLNYSRSKSMEAKLTFGE